MLKTFKYRLYPTKAQACLLDKNMHACRFIYNLSLELKTHAYTNYGKSLSAYNLINQLPDLKKECPWLKEVDSQGLQQSIQNLDKAFNGFFNKKTNYPKFKNKNSAQSFTNPQGFKLKIVKNKIILPKFKAGIKFSQDRPLIGIVKRFCISKTKTGQYYISVSVETGVIQPNKVNIVSEASIGIDLGLSHFAITSEGLKIKNPRFLRSKLDRIKVLQRRLRNKEKDSNNLKKARHRITVLHQKVANQRKDFLHKLSTDLINNHDTICIEDLNVAGMVKNHKLALSISDVGWSMFVDMLKYKAEWYGNNLLQIPTFEASTKICNVCNYKNNNLTLKDREWICNSCNTKHDRDINAAKSIKNYCITKSAVVNRKEPVEMLAVAKSMKQEIINY